MELTTQGDQCGWSTKHRATERTAGPLEDAAGPRPVRAHEEVHEAGGRPCAHPAHRRTLDTQGPGSSRSLPE